MSESSGLDASTVHSALGWIPGQGPTVDALETDLLIVDETSMANLGSPSVTVLRAAGPRTHVVLVGDADQLAPVGAGKPSPSSSRGSGPDRRAHPHLPPGSGSMIVRGAHAVRQATPRRSPHGRNEARPLPDRAR